MTKVFRIALLLALPAIMVAQTVTADFGNRLPTAYPISPGILGAQYSNPMSSAPINSTYSAGFRTLRMHGWLQSVYASRTANWSTLDLYLGAIQSVNVGKQPGFKVILELTYTPPWLVPTVQGCPAPGTSGSYKVPPEDVTTWANLAQSIVAHVDQNYPGLVTDYEIWNEPELGTFCVYPNDATTRLNRYLAIYAATAPLIRAQLAKDNAVARIGGPTISNASSIGPFIGGLLNNSSTAPYVDFVSYHKYPAGQSDITGGMLWDQTSPTGVGSLYSRIQSTSVFSGFGAEYLSIANTVKAGKQPNPTQTKIYMDEYNDDWAFSDDCCRNSAAYSPLFNGLVMLDMLDAVYQGAHRVPDSLEYYSLSNPPFCLIGDSGTHCGASTFSVLYPQYYLYELFGSPNYLNLSSAGGYMANSISPLPTNSGLAATAFWSSGQDSIVVVNPTGTNYGSVTIAANNPGFTVAQVTEYLLNNSNKSITSSTLTASSTVNVSVPAYSVVALKLTGSVSTIPDFTLSASPSSQTVTQGGKTSYTATITAMNGFTGAVTFAASGLPSGATASFSPASVTGSGSSTLTISTSASTPVGTYPITITATSGTTLQHTAQVALVVNAPGFTLAATPASRTITQGGNTSYTATITAMTGFTGVATFAASGLPSGATASFSPTSVTASGSSTLSISSAANTAPGNYTVTITATSGSIQHTATVTLGIQGFTLTASPSSKKVHQGHAASYAATLTALNGFSGTETMSVTGLPSGATASFTPASVSGSGTSTMSVSTSTSTPTGSYTLTLKATSTSGNLFHTAVVTLSVQ
jgi:Glycosyl hydrolases family 39